MKTLFEFKENSFLIIMRYHYHYIGFYYIILIITLNNIDKAEVKNERYNIQSIDVQDSEWLYKQ